MAKSAKRGSKARTMAGGKGPKVAKAKPTTKPAAKPSKRPKPAKPARGQARSSPAGLRIVVNAKAYLEVTGADGALALAKACAGVPGVALAAPLAELASLARRRPALGVPLFGQHCDPRGPGATTGWVTADALQAAGAVGCIVNHAEHKLPHADVATIVHRLHELGMASLVCADSLAEAKTLAVLKPTMLAIEPPELIGGDVSVTTADPSIVAGAVEAVRRISPATLTLCGAGVKTGADVAAALRLGAHGVLLASGVVKAADQAKALRDLARGLG